MVLRSRCTAALLLPGRAAAKYAIPQPAPIAQLDRASDYESEGRVFESPWAHSVFRVVSTRLRVGCVARLGWTSRAGVAACCCGATARTQPGAPTAGPASHRGRRNPDLGASLSRLLARAHEALTRNAINLAAVACLPAFGFGVPGPSCHEVPTRVPHAADEVVDGARPTSACAMGSIPLPAALNGLGRLLHLRKPRQWAGGARCESQREDQGRL